jgi:hypothetical protein
MPKNSTRSDDTMKQSVAERSAISRAGEIANTERVADETGHTRRATDRSASVPAMQRPTVTTPAPRDVWS